jgi:single-strand selective monofunctional uracil DNA glycosylase
MNLLEISQELSQKVDAMRFSLPVTHVYNPLNYAWDPHRLFIEKYGEGQKDYVFMGMNPGPWGMAQTGIPFGEVNFARDWLKVSAPVGKPQLEHPKRPISGFECTRSEVSGARIWAWAKERFGTAERFFESFYVINYCPLSFMEESGRNRTPDKLPPLERKPLFKACDEALQQMIAVLKPKMVIGVGAFAESQAARTLADSNVRIGRILHPSPASPAANRGWAAAAEKQLLSLGILEPDTPLP